MPSAEEFLSSKGIGPDAEGFLASKGISATDDAKDFLAAKGLTEEAPPSTSSKVLSTLGTFAKEFALAPLNVAVGIAQTGWHVAKHEAKYLQFLYEGDLPSFKKQVAGDQQFMQSLISGAKADPLGTLIGLTGQRTYEAYKSGSFDPILEHPGQTLGELALTVPQVFAPAAAGVAGLAAKARPVLESTKIGARALTATDKALATIVSKYNFTEGMYGLEARREGEYLLKSTTQTKTAVEAAAELARTDPAALPFLAPALEYSKRDMVKFRKELQAATPLGPGGGPIVPFNFKGKNLLLSVDRDGFISYTPASVFQTLSSEAQARGISIRSMIDTNTKMLYERGIIKDDELYARFFASYLTKTYRAHYDPKAWLKELRTQHPQWLADAQLWLDTHNTGLSVEHILNKAKEVTGVSTRAITMGPFKNPVSQLVKRVEIPPALERILGPMGPEYAAVRIGHTLDAQIRILANDAAFENMSSMLAADGRRLLIPKPSKAAPAAPQSIPLDYQPLEQSNAFGRWGGSWVHPDVQDMLPTLQGAIPNRTWQMYLRAWKAAKTIWNPGTHLNNFLGNIVFGHLVGNSPFNLRNVPYYTDAFTHLVKAANGKLTPELARAMELGAVRHSFAGTELKNLASNIPGLFPTKTWPEAFLTAMTDRKLALKLRNFYDAEDQLYRYSAYLKLTRGGMAPERASIQVNKYMPSYTTTSPLGQALRGEGRWGTVGMFAASPFTSFQLETLRIYALAAKEHPFRLFAAQSVPLMMTQIGLGNAGLTLNDYHGFSSRLPPQHRGKALVPLATDANDLKWIDVSNVWPMGRLLQSQGPGGVPFFSDLVGSGPAWSLFQLWTNIDLRTGRPLADPARGQGWDYALRKAMTDLLPIPSFATNMYRRVPQSLAGVSPRRNVPPESVLDALGGSLTGLLEGRETSEFEAAGAQYRKGATRKVKEGQRAIKRDPTLLPSERQRYLFRNLDELLRIKEGR